MPPCPAGVTPTGAAAATAAPAVAASSSSDDDSASSAASVVQQLKSTAKLSTASTDTIFVDGDDTPTLDFRNVTEWISFVFGCIFLITIGPFVGIVVFSGMIWEALDRKFDGGFVNSNKELSGFIFTKFVPWLRNSTHNFNKKFVKREEDSYMMNCIYGFGIAIPILFGGCVYYTKNYGMSYALAFVYHLVRIGPFFMNFAYVYTLCHKVGHSHVGLYSKGYNDSIILRNIFN